MYPKNKIRTDIDNLKKSLTVEKRKEYDKSIYENVISSPYYRNSSVIFIFVSYNNEVDTHKIIRKGIEDGKTICVPKVISKQYGMKAVKICSFSELHKGAYGILEPIDDSMEIEPSAIETIFLPGVAFDIYGGRVGYGGGFYDRFLKRVNSSTHKIALSYSFQILDMVPMERNDERIEGIITERGMHTIY